MDFLIENWKWIATLAIGLIELVLLLVFKRKPQIKYVGLVSYLCDRILEAEKRYTFGSEKMLYVLQCAKSYLGEMYDEKTVRNVVEYLLTLPEKKKEKML